MKGLTLLASVGAILFAIAIAAAADLSTHRHPPEHAQLHEEFYSKWKRPDDPATSCCGGQDCFPVEIKYEGGRLYVKSKWNDAWVYMPPEKIDRRNTSPDGQNHACLSPVFLDEDKRVTGNIPYCYIPGQGT